MRFDKGPLPSFFNIYVIYWWARVCPKGWLHNQHLLHLWCTGVGFCERQPLKIVEAKTKGTDGPYKSNSRDIVAHKVHRNYSLTQRYFFFMWRPNRQPLGETRWGKAGSAEVSLQKTGMSTHTLQPWDGFTLTLCISPCVEKKDRIE